MYVFNYETKSCNPNSKYMYILLLICMDIKHCTEVMQMYMGHAFLHAYTNKSFL